MHVLDSPAQRWDDSGAANITACTKTRLIRVAVSMLESVYTNSALLAGIRPTRIPTAKGMGFIVFTTD